MRIAFVSRRYFPAISGMSVYARNLLTELVARGHDLVMISQYRGDEAGTRVYGGGPPPALDGVEVIGLEAHGEQVVAEGRPADFEADIAAMVAAVEAAHDKAPFDVLHAQYGYPNGLAVLEASRRLGVPNVVSIQGGDGHWVGSCCRTHKIAMLAVLEHAGALLIGSRSFAEEVRGHHGTSLDRFTIVPGATDTNRFAPRSDRPLGALGDPPTLLFHGRVDARKGVLELLDAVRQLVDGGRRLRVEISGIGPDVAAVAQRTAELRLGEVVRCSGYASYDVAPERYRGADVFVSPTWSEGFSNTILEAMASGLPVVSTASVGVVDCLRHDDNGLLVEPHDTGGLAGVLALVLDDGERRRRLAETALEEVRRRYAWPVLAETIEGCYRRLAPRPPKDHWPPLERLGMPVDLGCRFRSQPHLL